MGLTIYSVPRPLPITKPVAAYPAGLEMNDVVILQMLADGLTVKTIARERKMSERQVRAEVRTIAAKMKVKNARQAVAWAVKNRVIFLRQC